MRNTALAFVFPLCSLLALAGAAAENRTALLVANGNYANFGKLTNPVPEARALKAALEKLGFKANLVENASREAMVDALADFEASLKTRGGIAFFHYGGHGVQVGGKNYLIPANAEIPDEKRVASRCLDLDEVMAALDSGGSETNIVVLDACRNNPLPAQAGRTASRGLAVVGTKPRNSIIVYAAESGNAALDGLFTPALTRALGTPGLSLTDVVMQVRKEVWDKSRGAQTPGEYNQLFAPVYLAGVATGKSAGPAAPASPAPQAAAPTMTIQKSYGSLVVSAVTAGTLYLDGTKLGDLPASAKATLNNIETGERSLELRYADGQSERQGATVAEGQAASVVFSYRKAAQPPAGAALTTGNFVRVPGGTFTMGSPASEKDRSSDEGPQHQETLTAFAMGKYEVTFDEYDEYCAATGTSKPSDSGWGRGNRPVINVSWYDAVNYCNWRSTKEGLSPAYAISGTSVSWNRGANGYRLPTEAEWEYACRAGTQTATSFGDTLVSSQANFDGNYSYNASTKGQYLQKTAPVGSYTANAFGLFDLHGNVWEWCWDWYDSGYYGKSPGADPQGPDSGGSRVLRGGSWFSLGNDLRSANRNLIDPTYRNNNLGFRVVR